MTSDNSPLKLLDLPIEIIHNILSLLPHVDLAACKLLNRYINDIVSQSPTLQYSIALTLAKADDNPCSVASLSEKIEDIRSSDEAWSNLQPRFIMSLPIGHRTSGIYDLSGGTYLLGNADRIVLQYLQLPSAIDDPLEWKTVAVDKPIIDMGFCVFEHDLIAIITISPNINQPGMSDIEMTLLEYSTGRLHPKAKESRVFVMTSAARPSLMCEIVGNNLVLILNFLHALQSEDRVFIWDWQTNVLKATFSAPFHTYSGLLFLSEDLILLPNTRSATFDIFRIPDKPIAESPQVILSLALPSLTDGIVLNHVTCRAEPNPIPDMSRLHKKKRAQDRAKAGMNEIDPFAPRRGFLASADEAICIFQLRFRNAVIVIQAGINVHFEMGHSCTLFVHRNSFVDLVRKYEGSFETPNLPRSEPVTSDPQQHSHTRQVPWVEWGPPVSRWFNADSAPTRWITTSAGQRCVMICEDGGSPLTVLDFNPNSVRKVKAKLMRANEARKEKRRAEQKRMPGIIEVPEETSSESVKQADESLTAPLISPSLMDVFDGINDSQYLPGPSSAGGVADLDMSDDDNSDSWITTDEYENLLAEEQESEIDQDDSSMPDLASVSNDSDEECEFFRGPSRTSDPNDYRNPGRVRYRINEAPSSLDSPGTFAEEVEGHLSYVGYVSEREFLYDGVLLDEERILGITTDEIDRISDIDILYFG